MEKERIQPLEIEQGLVALELQEPDQVILDYLAFFSDRIPVKKIRFLHVLSEEDIFDISGEFEEGKEVDEALIDMMEVRVKEALQKDERRIEYDIKKGGPLEILIEASESMNADLTIIGQSVEESEHGILAKNLVRKISSNALIVPSKSKPELKRMLVPIDFSDNSARALRTAVAINKCLEVPVEIVALNAYELPNMSSYKISRSREEFTEMFEKNILEGFEAFCHTHIPEDRENVRIRLVEKEFPATADYILEYARDHKADLIVTGAKGHSKVELLLLGSVTESLMEKNEDIPTLIVK